MSYIILKKNSVTLMPQPQAPRRWSGCHYKKSRPSQPVKINPDEATEDVIKSRIYTLPRKKVREKAEMFFEVKKSKKFAAFYSLSFPVGIEENDAYTVFNYWLTHCRKHLGLKSYLWVAERQKNGTIHYHLITNDYMPIKSANGQLRIILNNYSQKHNKKWQNIKNYNGLDVDNIYYPKARNKGRGYRRLSNKDATRKVSCYLTKYITKNLEEFTRLAWHCSRSVSALATAVRYDMDERGDIIEWCEQHPDRCTKWANDHCEGWYFPFDVNILRKTGIYERNNAVFELVERRESVPYEYYKF